MLCRRKALFYAATLPAVSSVAGGEDVHLKAAYASAGSPVKKIMALYREIEAVEVPPGTYSTVSFNGGYVGLASPGRREKHLNFSIWDTKEKGRVIGEAELVEASTRGKPRNHRFGHEGSGFHSELDYAWKPGVRYKVFVAAAHTDGQTTYSAWFGIAGTKEWMLIARIKRPGIHSLHKSGGFLEHVGKKNPDLTRSTAFNGGWVNDGAAWHPIHKVRFTCKDPTAADAVLRNDQVLIRIGQGLTSAVGSSHIFDVTPCPMPVLPEL